MKKYLFISSVLFLLSMLSLGQENLRKTFYNLPIEKSIDEIKAQLMTDTLMFDHELIRKYLMTYHPIKKDSVLNFYPLRVSITLNKKEFKTDSIKRNAITLYLNFGKQRQKAMKSLYQSLVDSLKIGFGDVRYEYIEGLTESGGQKKKVDENMAYFYTKKGDKDYSFVCTWFYTKNVDNLFILTYYKN